MSNYQSVILVGSGLSLAVRSARQFTLSVTATNATYTLSPQKSVYTRLDTITITITPSEGYTVSGGVWDKGAAEQWTAPINGNSATFKVTQNTSISFTAAEIIGEEPPANMTTYIEKDDIRWDFDEAVEYGYFANGDPYVIGPVNVVGISPQSKITEQGDKDAVGNDYTVGTTINGSMTNIIPQNTNGYTSAANFNSVGWDSALNVAMPNGQILSAQNPLVLSAGTSLVSTESRFRTSVSGINTCVYRASVLTVLAEAPPAGSFRPSYAGTDKTIRYNVSDLDYSKLANLEPSLFQVPSLDAAIYTYAQVNQEFTFNNAFDRVWLDHGWGEFGRTVHPLLNMPEYGAGMCQTINNVALMLNVRQHADPTTNNNLKSRMLIGLVQYGIDLFGVIQANTSGYSTWGMSGGHGPGRKMPILFAGTVLDDADMLAIGKEDKSDLMFGEDGTTYYLFRREVEKWLRPINESDPDYEDWPITWEFETWVDSWGEDPEGPVKVKYFDTNNTNRNRADAYYSEGDFASIDLTQRDISDWQSGVEYYQNDIVKVSGVYYIARKKHTSSLGNAPTDTPVKCFTTHANSSGMTQITCPNHGFNADDEIIIYGVQPYDLYRGWHTVVSATQDTFVIDTPRVALTLTCARVHKGVWEKAEEGKYLGIPEYGYEYGGLVGSFYQGRRISANADAPYRQNWDWPVHGAVLTALIMEFKDDWRHDALFDYMDRYVAWFGTPTANFYGKMWGEFRADFC